LQSKEYEVMPVDKEIKREKILLNLIEAVKEKYAEKILNEFLTSVNNIAKNCYLKPSEKLRLINKIFQKTRLKMTDEDEIISYTWGPFVIRGIYRPIKS
jgi:hypothetical protein